MQFTLFDGFLSGISKDRLEKLEELSNGNARFLMENTVQGIILGYYSVLLQREQLKVLIRNKEFRKNAMTM